MIKDTRRNHVWNNQSKAQRELLDYFVNQGDTCVRVKPENVLNGSKELEGYDVVFVKPITNEFREIPIIVIIEKAIQLADKRVIISVDKEVDSFVKGYLARVKYHWENYDYEVDGKEQDTQYYIIDKEA